MLRSDPQCPLRGAVPALSCEEIPALVEERHVVRGPEAVRSGSLRDQDPLGPCFVCAFLKGEPGYEHELVYEDADHVAFLHRWPTLPGKVLVAPREHVEDVVSGFSDDGYMRMMQAVRRVALAVEAVLAPERVYLLSLGSRQGNPHVHWHVAALPPGTESPVTSPPPSQHQHPPHPTPAPRGRNREQPAGAGEDISCAELSSSPGGRQWPGTKRARPAHSPFVSPANRLRGVGEFSASEQ
ncbi:HIT family protein [Streptomyces luridiscabiei]|uniref:HIT family protein n=1 Tax=Streptomyces luridiscabiei TaxID=164114 RepID=UPI002D21A3C0|nr:HIT domain-containing protein [Streptomyces luridiscabiei]